MKRVILMFGMAAVLLAADAFGADVEILRYHKREFSPALGEKFVIPYRCAKEGNLTIEILTPDGNPVKKLDLPRQKIGTHKVEWDGKDRWGDVVPDEAYVLRLHFRTSTGTETLGFLQTGGEKVRVTQKKADNNGNILFTLPRPSRVSLKVGVPEGPMLRVLASWEPMSAGKVRKNWNFVGEGGVTLPVKKYVVSLEAITLPRHAIITTGNTKESYLEYYLRHGFQCQRGLKVGQKLPKNVSPKAYRCLEKLKDPKIVAYFVDASRKKHSALTLDGNGSFVVRVEAEKPFDRLLERSDYEVSFYVDFRFASEAERGYIPISWRYSPAGPGPGNHILTVNLVTSDGRAGAYNLVFKVDTKQQSGN